MAKTAANDKYCPACGANLALVGRVHRCVIRATEPFDAHRHRLPGTKGKKVPSGPQASDGVVSGRPAAPRNGRSRSAGAISDTVSVLKTETVSVLQTAAAAGQLAAAQRRGPVTTAAPASDREAPSPVRQTSASRSYQHRDPAKRRAYMREHMRRKRAKGKSKCLPATT